MTKSDDWMDDLDGIDDGDDDDPAEQALRPYRPSPARRRPTPPAPGGTQVFTVAIGDASKLIAPGAVEKFCVFPQRTFQLVKIELAQYPALDAGGLTRDAGGPCWWPIELCYAGDRVIGGPQGLHTGSCEPVTCQLGQRIELMVRNPLSVPAAVSGCLIGRTMRHDARPLRDPRPPITAADLEQLVREAAGVDEPGTCHACGEDLTGAETWHDDGRTYCKACWDRRELGRRLTTLSTVCVDCGVRTPGYLTEAHAGPHCGACVRRHRASPLVTRAAAGLPDLAAVVSGHDNVRLVERAPPPRTVYYCEAAPPREVVEAATCLLDGDEVGAPALHPHMVAPLVYTARMLLAWARHRDFNGTRAALRSLYVDTPGRADHDVAPPRDPDAYGGRVATSLTASLTGQRKELVGYRCALCGAWLRAVEVRP